MGSGAASGTSGDAQSGARGEVGQQPMSLADLAGPASRTTRLDKSDAVNAEFWMFKFKIDLCPRRDPHDWEQCLYAHRGEKARRRHPSKYKPVQCPEARAKSLCPRGDDCPCTHNLFEYWLHPSRFRTCICEQGPGCSRPICFFAHCDEERRPLPEGSTDASLLPPAAEEGDTILSFSLWDGEGAAPGAAAQQAALQHVLQQQQLQVAAAAQQQQQQLQAAARSSSGGVFVGFESWSPMHTPPSSSPHASGAGSGSAAAALAAAVAPPSPAQRSASVQPIGADAAQLLPAACSPQGKGVCGAAVAGGGSVDTLAHDLSAQLSVNGLRALSARLAAMADSAERGPAAIPAVHATPVLAAPGGGAE